MRICAGDLEANGFVAEATKVWCGVFIDINTKEVHKFGPDDVYAMLKFMDTCDELIFHNGIGYDMPLLRKLYNYEYKGKLTDTLVMSRLYDPKRMRPFGMQGKGGPHSIEAWGYRVGRGKPDHDDWSQFSDAMLHRCTEDVEILCLVHEALQKEAASYNWRGATMMTMKLFTILQSQEEYGWLVDRPHLEKSLYFLNKWMDKIDEVLEDRLPLVMEVHHPKVKGQYGWVKKPFLKSGKPNKNVQEYWGEDAHLVGGPHTRIGFRRLSLDKDAEIKGYLLDLGWVPKEWNIDKETGEKRSPKLNKDDPFEGVDGKMGSLIVKRLQCKHRRSVLEGWRERIRPDGRLASIVSGLAATGRATHKDIANVPNVEAFFGKWMRKCFTCPEGRVLIGCDAGSCQDRMLAQRAQNQQFTDMLLNGDKDKGTDGHSLAMKAVNKALAQFGLPLISRGKAKNFNFGWKFGASDNKLGQMVGANKDVGAAIRKELEAVFPAQAALVERLTEEWRSNAKKSFDKWGRPRYTDGWITGLDGRPIFIPSEHAILVYVLQSDEAICMAAAYNLLYNRLIKAGYQWGKDWAYVCWYHDEYTIECREELADIIKPMAEQAIADAGKLFKLTHCPQIGDAEIGRNWYDIH